MTCVSISEANRFLKEGPKVAFDLFEFPSIADSQRRTAKNVQILEGSKAS
ncbi:hypothetical protein PAJ34TS1_30000 [Paenibacillus azoreducens]